MKKYIITFSDKRKKPIVYRAPNRPTAIAECQMLFGCGFVVEGATYKDMKKAKTIIVRI